MRYIIAQLQLQAKSCAKLIKNELNVSKKTIFPGIS